MTKLCWRSTKDGKQKIKGYFLVKDLVEIREGLVRGKKITGKDKNQRRSNCFSIITKHKKETLELEAPTQNALAVWKGYFEKLITSTNE